MDVIDFLELVEGAMRWELEKEDRLFEQSSIFAAHIMLSTGNYKRNTQLDQMRKQLYLPLEDRFKIVNEQQTAGKDENSKAEVEKKKAELQEKFNI